MALLAELDGIFALKEEPKTSLVAFLDTVFFFSLLYSQVCIQASLPHAGALMWPEASNQKPQHMEDNSRDTPPVSKRLTLPLILRGYIATSLSGECLTSPDSRHMQLQMF